MRKIRPLRLIIAAVGSLAFCLPTCVFSAEEDFTTSGGSDIPVPVAASDAGTRAIAKMRTAPGLKAELYAAEPMLANPVALTFDDKGRCYVIETWRLDHGVIDDRHHMDWLDDDLACKTVEDRLKLIHRKMGPNARTFARYPDVIRLLEDTKGTGVADKSTVFAEFSDILDGLAAGIVTQKNNVYVTNIPNLWLLQDTKGAGTADVKQSLSYGYGVRYNFIGHDLHGPRFGPDGKLYFSIGDRGLNIEKSVDNRHVENTESGSVLRCNADGSGLEIYATGLRNPQCLAFDEYGNLFTGDNNPDYGDPARWVYVVQNGDSGWRVGYQYAHNPIGGGPWMWEKLWITQDKSTATYFLPPIEDIGAGPSGVAYYPGTGLSHDYDHHFFECDFRGGFTGSGVRSFVMKPRGAGFELVKDKQDFLWDTLTTDIVFGPQGGAYVTDWVQGWNVKGVGRIYHVVDPEAMKESIVSEVKNLLAEGFEKRPNDELIALLGHRDQRIRQEAQFELADRGSAVEPLLAATAASATGQLARIHAIWALGQIANSSPAALKPILPLLEDKDDEIRAQAAHVLGDHHDADAFDDLVKLLADPSLRVRYFAAMGLAQIGRKDAIRPVLAMIRENDDKDVYLRHAGVMALVSANDEGALQAAARDDSRAIRLASLLAMRRLEKPEIAGFLHDPDPQLVLEAARAINDLPIQAALPQLAALIVDPKLPDFVMFRVVNANYRLGTSEAAKALAAFAANPSAPEEWRAEALHDLADWGTPLVRDRVTDADRPLPARDPEIARDAAGPAIAAVLQGAPDKVRIAALELIQKIGVKDSSVLLSLESDPKLSADVRIGAIRALAGQKDARLPEAIDVGMRDADEHVRAAAITAMVNLPDPAARLESLLDKGTIRERQAAFASLGATPGESAGQSIASWVDKLISGQVEPELQLDVLEAAGLRHEADVAGKLSRYEQSIPNDEHAAYHLGAFRVALQGGDAVSGEKIFHERADASCLRCHKVHGTGGIVGPVLDGIASRQNREYMLESIIYPNAKIAPGFESVIVRLNSGKTETGIVKKESDEHLELIDADGHKIEMDKADIKSRERGPSAMPEGFGNILSKRDIRDLVAYLASLKK